MPVPLHSHKMLTLSGWVAKASHARLSCSTQATNGCLQDSGNFKQWNISRIATPPFKVSDSARNFPPSISLSSGGALGLSADTGPSAGPAALRRASTAQSLLLRNTLDLLLYVTRHMTRVHKEVHY